MPTPQAPLRTANASFPSRSRLPFQVVPVPSSAPPYDRGHGEPGRTRASTRAPCRQGALALAFVLPSGTPALPSPGRWADLSAAPTGRPSLRTVADDPVFAPQRTTRTVLPNPRSWAALLGQAVVEVLAGHRPATQLVRWMSGRVHASLADLSLDERGQRTASRHARAVVRSVRVFEPADGIAEAAVVVRESRRCWAMALRLEGVDGRWLCTEMVLG